MWRREFLLLSGAAAAAWPRGVIAQTPARRPLIAYLAGATRERTSREIGAFVQGLQELGFVEGRDFDIEYRFTDGLVDRSGVLAEELLTLKPNVIFAAITPAAVAARALTQTVPIVCPLLADPLRFGLIASEARPAGNVTGVLSRVDGLAGKQLEFGLKVLPDATRVGMLVNALSAIITDRQEVEQASQTLGIKLIPAEVSAPDDIDKAFQTLANGRVQAAIVLGDAMFFNERQRIAAAAAAARLPTIFAFRAHVDAGGLISYGINYPASFHRAASYVARILKGAKPGDLPVEFPTKLELVINLKAARALGLMVPPLMLTLADEVIE
jgi:putative tryptophan/tyrosine transport system substrate-binding protein